MGADLIGYIVKGPVSIKDKKAKATLFAQSVRLGHATHCGNCDVDFDADPDDNMCPECGAEILVFQTRKEAAAFAMRYMKDWPPDFRDVASRIDPDDPTQVIVFAGEHSWGEEPEGGGYGYMKDILTTGLASFMGVR